MAKIYSLIKNGKRKDFTQEEFTKFIANTRVEKKEDSVEDKGSAGKK